MEVYVKIFNRLNNKRTAFTMAEVLITLSIVGIIAVLTLPNVMASYTKRTTVAQLQRTYNSLRTAFTEHLSNERANLLSNTDMNSKMGVYHFLQKYMNSAKICAWEEDENTLEVDASGKCVAESYLDLSGNPTEIAKEDIDDFVCAVLEFGTSICIRPASLTEKVGIYIDVTGSKIPNRLGHDLFYFEANNDGKLEVWNDNAEDCSREGGVGLSCFYKIVKDGWSIDY